MSNENHEIPMINIRGKNWVSNGGGEYQRERSFAAKSCAFEMYDDIEMYYAKGAWEIVRYVGCDGIEERIGQSCLAHLQKYMRYLKEHAGREAAAKSALVLTEGHYARAKYLLKIEDENPPEPSVKGKENDQ